MTIITFETYFPSLQMIILDPFVNKFLIVNIGDKRKNLNATNQNSPLVALYLFFYNHLFHEFIY